VEQQDIQGSQGSLTVAYIKH